MKFNEACLLGMGLAVSILVIAALIDVTWGGENYWDYAFFVVAGSWAGITLWLRKLR